MNQEKITEYVESLKDSGAGPFGLVVSGVPRSGTSLAMLCTTKAIGEDRVLGSKFPRQQAIELKRGEDESDKEFELRSAIHARTVTQEVLDDFNASVDMNPNGFWECGYSVQGFQYEPGVPDLSDKAVKIVSSGLHSTDPSMISRLVYMIRHPRSVAKSQERIRRMQFMSAADEAELGIHTPEMFIRQSFMAAKWFIRNPEVPRLFVEFEDLVADPENVLRRLSDFTGYDYSESPIEPRLQRSSKPEDQKEHFLFEYAMPIYQMMRRQDFEGVVRYYLEHQRQINKENTRTFCLRLDHQIPYNVCLVCKSGAKDFIRNKIDQAEARDVDWMNEPCSFECGGDPFLSDAETLTLEESVNRNHWLEFSDADPE